MKKILLLLIMFVSGQIFSQATYTSAGDNLSWNGNAMWTLTSGSDGDSDGVPDSNDNVIINHNVTITGSRTVNNLTVNYADGKKLTISGNGASLSVEGNATNSNGEILITG